MKKKCIVRGAWIVALTLLAMPGLAQKKQIGQVLFKMDKTGIKLLMVPYGLALDFATKKVGTYKDNKLFNERTYPDINTATNNFLKNLMLLSTEIFTKDAANALLKAYSVMQVQALKLLEKDRNGTVSGVVLAVKGGDTGFARLGNNVIQLAMGKPHFFN
ncbi:MAG: hypothetical protein GY757_15130, partial [bacterium]|nr:hypothetical protein [bacterium]